MCSHIGSFSLPGFSHYVIIPDVLSFGVARDEFVVEKIKSILRIEWSQWCTRVKIPNLQTIQGVGKNGSDPAHWKGIIVFDFVFNKSLIRAFPQSQWAKFCLILNMFNIVIYGVVFVCSGVARIFRGGMPRPLKGYHAPPQGVRGAKPPRKLAKFHFLERCKLLENESSFQKYQHFLPKKSIFPAKN